MHLFSSIENGKKITHIHNGANTSFCGHSDVYKVEEKVLHKKPNCKECIKVIKDTLKVAKNWNIK